MSSGNDGRVRAARLLGALLALVVLAAGCSALPESGAVHRQRVDETTLPRDAPYFNPPGPAHDADPSAIVSGFMLAMQANPLSTSVARRFLSTQARATWQPNRGTVVYEAFSVDTTAEGTDVRLADTRRLDGRGGWLGDRAGRTQQLRLELVSERGQWRIDNPPDTLVVPTSFFERTFARFDLYFYDQTGRALVPDPVFIPRGEQGATNLVRGLLAGPGRGLADVSRSALPSGTGLDLSVVVTESGVAEVPLSREVLQLDPRELTRAVDQLAWTLRQVPDVRRVRLTVGGTPVPLPGGRVDAPVTAGRQYDPAGPNHTPVLWGLRGGRVDDLSSGDRAVPGPLGRGGYALRSLAVGSVPPTDDGSRTGTGRAARSIAAVSQDGGTVFVAPADEGTAGSVRAVVRDGTDVLRPSYDMFGDLWLVDRTSSGARVLVVSRGRVREVRVPGVTGADVVAFSVARDGARMAVAYAGTPAPPVRVTDLLRTDEGAVSGAGRSHTIVVGDGPRTVDLGWRDPSTLAVLLRPTAETSVVDLVPYDGSPLPVTGTTPSTFRGAAQSLVVSPDGRTPLRLVTPDQRLFSLSSGGDWPRTATRVTAAAYAD
ncbi:MAG: hypothetical protein JWR20_2108 [Marmoricola sp.]|nr:hypothetical protein [Marmoricola sp.]